MKKYLLVIICSLLLLPMSVFADIVGLDYSTNKHVMVGGYWEVQLERQETLGNNELKEINLEYDPNEFSINKNDISVYTCNIDITFNKDVVITLSKGKVSIKTNKDIASKYCYSTSDYTIKLDFLALKSGEAEMRVYGDFENISGGVEEILQTKVSEHSCNSECPKCEQKECPVCEETKCPEIVEEKNFIKDNAILLMLACFVVGVLLGFVIFHGPMKKSKSKPDVASEENEDKKE